MPRIDGGGDAGREIIGRRKDGSEFPAELAASEIPELGLLTCVIRDISSRRDLERQVVEIALQEQRRIGQDLHDSVGQELTALNLLAGDLVDVLNTNPAGGAGLVQKMVGGLGRCRVELRSVLRGLLPVAVDHLGLMAALAELAERIDEQAETRCTFECSESVSVADNLTATHLYLIAQEAAPMRSSTLKQRGFASASNRIRG